MTEPRNDGSEWYEIPTTTSSVSDEALARHLVRRGSGIRPTDLATSIQTRIAATKQEPGWRRTGRALRPVAAIAACLVFVLVGTLIVTAPRSSVSAPGPTAFDPATRPMTVAELIRYNFGTAAVGKTVIVDDDISSFVIACPSSAACPFGILAGYAAATHSGQGGSSWVYPANPDGSFPDAPVHGPVALRVREDGFTYLGRVAAAPSEHLAWSVSTMRSLSGPPDSVLLVHGWLGVSSIEPPCAPQLSPEPMPLSVDGQALALGCGQVSYVSDTNVSADASVPVGAIRTQNDAYALFGAEPTTGTGRSDAPREGDFLVRPTQAPETCGPKPPEVSPEVVCSVSQLLGWEVISRLDRISIPPSTTSTPAPAPTATPGAPTWDPTQRPLTPPEFLRVIGGHPAPGTILIVDDQIVSSGVSCFSAAHCPEGELESAPSVLIEPPPGGVLTFTTNTSTVIPAIPGPIALQVTDGPDLVFLGGVLSKGDRLGFTASELTARNAMGGLFVIPGWIVAGLSPNCPSPADTPQPTSELGLPAPAYECTPSQWLTDTAQQPQHVSYDGNTTNIVTTPPSDGIEVQPGAYQSFSPTQVYDANQGFIAQWGIFLMRDWGGRGEILGRLETMAIPPNIGPTIENPPTPAIAPPPASGQPTVAPPDTPVGSVVWPIDDLVARVRAGMVPSGRVLIADIQESNLRPRWAPGAVHSCPQLCPEWLIGPENADVAIVVSMLSPEPAHIGRVAFLVNGNGLRLLGPVETQPDGHPIDVSATGLSTSTPVVVHGWLRDGLPVPCPSPPTQPTILGLDQVPLSFSCPGTWIQPTAADPFVMNSDGSGSYGMPSGSALVQDGADGSSQTPREGTFVIFRLDCAYSLLEGCQAITANSHRTELVGEVMSPEAP